MLLLEIHVKLQVQLHYHTTDPDMYQCMQKIELFGYSSLATTDDEYLVFNFSAIIIDNYYLVELLRKLYTHLLKCDSCTVANL